MKRDCNLKAYGIDSIHVSAILKLKQGYRGGLRAEAVLDNIYALNFTQVCYMRCSCTWGVLALESGTGMCRSHDPFFQASRRSLTYQFIINAPFMCPHPFPILEKKIAFSSLVFWPKFQLSRCKFSFPRPLIFLRKIHSLDPTFGNQCGTHPPKKKKKLSAPLPGNCTMPPKPHFRYQNGCAAV